MSTQINVSLAGSQLLQQNRDAQMANRQANVQKDADKAFAEDVKAIEEAAAQRAAFENEGAVPEYGTQEETSAQRKAESYIAPLEFFFTAQGNPFFSSANRLEFFERIPTGYSPFTTSNALSYATILPVVEDVPNYSDLPGYIASQITGDYPTYTLTSSNGDTWEAWWGITLPAGGKYVVLLFALRKVSSGHKEITVLTSTPPTAVLDSNTHVPLETVENVAYYCRLIDTKTWQFKTIETVPQQAKDHIDAFFPPLDILIGTEGYVYNVGGSDFNYVRLNNPDEFITEYPAPTPTSYLSYTGRRYHGVSPVAQVMAQSYGLGSFLTASHISENLTLPALRYGDSYNSPAGLPFLSNYITPAVFSYFNGTAALTPGMGTTYAEIREALGSAPVPSYFLSNLDEDYIVAPTKAQLFKAGYFRAALGADPPIPDDYTTPVNPPLVRDRKIKEKILGYPGRVWDWDNPQYCRTQLLALGFTAADLTMPPP